MTELYPCGQPALSSCLTDLGVGWRHTIIEEPNFVSPWEASFLALDLSFQLGTLGPLAALGCCHNSFATRSSRPGNSSAPSKRSVQFCDSVDLLLGLEDDLTMFSTPVTHDELCSNRAKSWGWFFCPDVWEYNEDEDSYSPMRIFRSALDPLSQQAVSIRQLPPIRMLRATDAWHQPLPSDLLQLRDVPEEEDPDVIPDPVRAPQFVHDLFELAGFHRVFTDQDDFGILRIRTWYLHHSDERRCWHPRILEYEEDWRRWETDLGFAWRSHIRPNEEIQIHVVHPDPYRGYMSRPVHADVIISQGHWLPHYSTLITVHQLGRTHVPLSFAIACSLERRVSGVRLADEADVLSFCNQAHARCSISFGWNRIPFSMQPTHEVHAGDAFTIQAGLDEAGAVGTHCADRSTAASASADHHTHANDVDYDMFDDGPPDAEEPHSCEASHSDSSLHSNDLSLLVYRLHAPEAHGFTQGRGYTAILNAAIRACHIPRSLVRCQHALHVNPTSILPEHEEAVILQTIDAIAPGSDEKLVLVDIEIHLHPLRDGLVVPAAHSRKVMKVNPHLHREQLLLLNGLRDYCQLERDRCVVQCNQQLWLAHDKGVRDMQHGFYFRISVPPPSDTELDTEIAIGIAREFGTDATTLRSSSADCHQALSLRQAAVSPTNHVADSKCMNDLAHDEPQLPIAPADAGRRTTRPPTPPSHSRFAPGVQRQLEALLQQADLIECEEEGRVMYVTTWYIHHHRARRCYEGSAVRLTHDSNDWLDTILEPWTHMIDHTQTVIVRIVRSTPPCNPWECVQAHLIIEQDSVVRQVSCLISHQDWRYPDQGWQHRAAAIDDFQNSRGILEAAELSIMCRLVHCQVMTRGLPFATLDFEEIGSAWNFVVYIQRPLLTIPQDPIELSDFNSLMQQAPSSHGLDLPPTGGECGHFDFDPLAPAFQPNRPNIWDLPEDIQELHDAWRSTASAWEQETPAAHFIVWFLCPGSGVRRCLHGRRVTLFDDFTTWRDRLIFAWRDFALPNVPVMIQVVDPHPAPLEHDITAHVILTQLMPDHESGVLVNVIDSAVNDAQPFRIAITIADPAHLMLFLQELQYHNEQANMELAFRQFEVGPGRLTPTRTGNCFDLRVTRATLPPNWAPPILPEVPGTEGLGLLQTKATLLKKGHSERLTHGLVAHTHGPLNTLTDEEETIPTATVLSLGDSLTTAIEVVAGDPHVAMPSYVEVPFIYDEADIEHELRTFGLDCRAFLFGRHRKAFCVLRADLQAFQQHHVLFANVDTLDLNGTFVHSFADQWTEIKLMQILHCFGYEKAFISSTCEKDTHFTVAEFGESHGSLEGITKHRPQSSWPPPQSTPKFACLVEPAETWDTTCLLTLGVDETELWEFFKPRLNILCCHFEGLDLPQVTQDAVELLRPCIDIASFDRLIIYVDGTSQPSQKHLPPLRVDAEGLPDAWAFLVLGECYTEEGSSTLHLLGWQAQQVRYDPNSPNFAGAMKTSSHIAEREGLFFAAVASHIERQHSHDLS